MKKIAMLVLMFLSVNSDAANNRSGEDSTGLSASFINSVTARQGVNAQKMYSQRINIPTREIVYNQPIYINNPPAEQQPIRCLSYETVSEYKQRFATSAESMCWGGCSCPFTGPAPIKPDGTYINTGSTAPTHTNKQCSTTYWIVPVFTNRNVCTQWGY